MGTSGDPGFRGKSEVSSPDRRTGAAEMLEPDPHGKS